MCKKSFLTNIITLAFIILSFFFESATATICMQIGLFAFSGSLTNWIAIHMLFEKVPGFYGSGVIQILVESIKTHLKNLIMEEFFSKERVLSLADNSMKIDFQELKDHVLGLVPYDEVFDKILSAVENSQVGGMLQMFGGKAVLEPLRPDIIPHMRQAISDILDSDIFQSKIASSIAGNFEGIEDVVDRLVQERLDELTPVKTKEIIQTMIRDHLGWLVVWGGVFGGLIGLFSAIINLI